MISVFTKKNVNQILDTYKCNTFYTSNFAVVIQRNLLNKKKNNI